MPPPPPTPPMAALWGFSLLDLFISFLRVKKKKGGFPKWGCGANGRQWDVAVPLSLCPSVPLSFCPSVPLSLCFNVPLF